MSSQPLVLLLMSEILHHLLYRAYSTSYRFFFEFHVMQDFVHQPCVASWGLWHYSGVHVQPGLRIFCGWRERFSVKVSEVDFLSFLSDVVSTIYLIDVHWEFFQRNLERHWNTEKVIVNQTWHLAPPCCLRRKSDPRSVSLEVISPQQKMNTSAFKIERVVVSCVLVLCRWGADLCFRWSQANFVDLWYYWDPLSVQVKREMTTDVTCKCDLFFFFSRDI